MRAITEKQLRRFYFPAWSACAKANGWVMAKGRLSESARGAHADAPVAGALPGELLRKVWMAAEALAVQAHRNVTAEDLRHGCTVVALGRNKSSKDFTNAELDRVVALFRLLAEPDDVAAMLQWNNPEIGERKRLVFAIAESAPAAYVARIASDRFGTELWEDLAVYELRQLVMTLRDRSRRWNERKPAAAQPALPEEFEQKAAKEAKAPEAANCPF
jgi:hypothetical protein